jgi:cytochrome oxidase Cu insertion factor (SCO1/SenC/PrrC family)
MLRSMMLALAGLVLACVAASAVAQDKDDLQAKYEAKVAEAWFKDNGFTDDYDVARQRSKETGKPIFAYFTRSYAG